MTPNTPARPPIQANGKVKRLHSACCGMENGKVYEAYFPCGYSYAKVLLPDGSWTEGHHVPKFFEILEYKGMSGEELNRQLHELTGEGIA